LHEQTRRNKNHQAGVSRHLSSLSFEGSFSMTDLIGLFCSTVSGDRFRIAAFAIQPLVFLPASFASIGHAAPRHGIIYFCAALPGTLERHFDSWLQS
jgi:hypothetical protein